MSNERLFVPHSDLYAARISLLLLIGLLAAADVYDEAHEPPGNGSLAPDSIAAAYSEALAADFGREFLEAFRSTDVFRYWSSVPRPKFREQAAKYSEVKYAIQLLLQYCISILLE